MSEKSLPATLRALGRTLPFFAALTALVVFSLTRVVLTALTLKEMNWTALPYIFGVGLINDAITIAIIVAPAAFVAALLPQRLLRSRIVNQACLFMLWFLVFVLLFTAIGEFFFWQEFGTRFNFIAVDYLVYTQEVFRNILQSYPVKTLLVVIGVVSGVAVWCMRRPIGRMRATYYGAGARSALLLIALAGPVALLASLKFSPSHANMYASELARNGAYTFVEAFFRNEIDYERFYATLPRARAAAIMASLREPAKPGKPSTRLREFLLREPKNVVLIMVESLSAEFLGTYGDERGLTPKLDRIALESLVFDRIFAAGTRTVRGLEAGSIGTPPVPGQSIVRRPNNGGLISIGEVLRHQGYENFFFYGGNSFFDNMGAYFGANGYRVVDRADFPPATIAFENAWGVADESLFANVSRVLDARSDRDKPFFAHVMTTSNHRPFTFPVARIDNKSGEGRDGAVKYTDYAIGKFLDDAKASPWFKDTLFVVVADHCAAVAGRVEMPVEKYRIPMMFYGPDLVRPGRVKMTVSQIDLPPMLLDLLGKEGQSLFYGRTVTRDDETAGRAFISTYQSLGYYKNDTLTVLKPKKVVESYRVDPVTLSTTPTPIDEELRDEAIAYYQSASVGFAEGDLVAPWLRKKR